MRLPLLAAFLMAATPAAADTQSLFEKGVKMLEFSASIETGTAPKTVFAFEPDGCRDASHCAASVGDATITVTNSRIVFIAGTKMKPGSRIFPCSGLAADMSGLGVMAGTQLGPLFNRAKAEGGEATAMIGRVQTTAIVTDGLIGGCAFEIIGDS